MKVILASGNKNKLIEFKRILEPLGYEIISQKEVCPDIEIIEDGETFAENAKIKAEAIFKETGLPTIADDSGLCVDALGGAPGVYSARYSGEPTDDKRNNSKLLEELAKADPTNRKAKFVCNICLILDENNIIETEGECRGEIAYKEMGDNGFGYDPLFMVGDLSFAQIPPEKKDALSHRGKALRALEEILKNK